MPTAAALLLASRRGRRRARRLVALLALAQAAVCAAADEPAPTPGSVFQTLPGEPALRMPPPSQLVFPEQPAPTAFDQDDKRFVVNAFDIHGATVFPQQRLKRAMERFVDMELNLYDLNRAADDLTRFYHDRGYTLARAYVPAQVVRNGVVRIEVIEGRMGKVQFSGNRRYSEAFLAERLPFLTSGAVVTMERLEDDLLRLNELPGLRSRVVLSPGTIEGTTDAEVQLEEALVDGTLNLSNFGRRETGQNRLEATVNLNAPFGLGDRLSVTGIATQGNLIKYWKLAYALPVGTQGMRLLANSSRVSYDVAGSLAALGVRGEMRSDEIALSVPLKRTRADKRTFTFGARRSQSAQTALGVTVSESRIAVYSAAYAVERVHADATVTNASLRLDSNFRKNVNGTDQDKLFARFDLDVNHTAGFVGRWDLFLRANVVYSRDTLPDSEKFALGGPTSVRGFRPSEVRGDSGHLLTAELRRPFALAGWMGQLRLTGDSGGVVYKMPGFRDSKDKLSSVGVGATLFPTKGTAASLDLAHPTGSSRTASDGRSNRLWVSFSALF